jgi:hypothetical protein
MLNLVFYDVNRLTKKMFESNKDLLPPSIFIRHIVLRLCGYWPREVRRSVNVQVDTTRARGHGERHCLRGAPRNDQERVASCHA